ncbi:MAG: hypothetical protein ABSF69_28780 [Polyangiaceae bacterium]
MTLLLVEVVVPESRANSEAFAVRARTAVEAAGRVLETTFAQDAPLDKQDWNFLVGMAEKWRKNEPFYGTRGR